MSLTAPGSAFVDIPLRWSDLDAYGHVNNVEYLRLLEAARVTAFADWFDASGSESILSRGILLAHQEIEYLSQLHLRPEPLRIHLWVTRIGTASFTLGYDMADPDGQHVYARAESTMATYDLEAGTVRAIPQEQRDILAQHEGPEIPFRRRR